MTRRIPALLRTWPAVARAAAILLVPVAATHAEANLSIYGDALANGFRYWSWAARKLNNTGRVVHISISATQTVRIADGRLFGVNTAIWDSQLATGETLSLLQQICAGN